MEKIFSVTFYFVTSGTAEQKHRLAKATDAKQAYRKACDWFSRNMPDSKLLSCEVAEPIE